MLCDFCTQELALWAPHHQPEEACLSAGASPGQLYLCIRLGYNACCLKIVSVARNGLQKSDAIENFPVEKTGRPKAAIEVADSRLVCSFARLQVRSPAMVMVGESPFTYRPERPSGYRQEST